VDFCAQFSAHQPATQAFCDRLVELDLLAGQQAKFTPEGEDKEQTIASYVAVDFQRLQKLDATTVEKLFKDGMLSAVYAHRFSMENWFRLLERRQRSSLARDTDNVSE
ncbi:MAG: SapC family protein, partial [Pseudomonadales bacterium]